MAQQWSLTEPAPSPRQGTGAIVTGVVLLLVGIVIAVAGFVGLVSTASRLIPGLGTAHTTPAEFTQTFDAGTTYAVYETATSGSGTPDDPYLGNVAPGDIVVTASDGSTVVVTDAPSFAQTVTSGSRTYVVVATFDPPVTTDYVVSVTTEGSTVVVAPALTEVTRSLAWLAPLGIGALVGLIGVIVLIAGLVRRSSRQPAAVPGWPGPGGPTARYPAPVLPPAGWYPDPERPGGQRYWDGSGWSEHRA